MRRASRSAAGCLVLRGHQEGEGLAEGLAFLVPEGPPGGGVEQRDQAPLVGHHDRVAGPLGELAVEPLRGPHRRFGPAPLGDLPGQPGVRPRELGGALLDPPLELVVRLAQRLLGALALGDHLGEHDHAADRAVVVTPGPLLPADPIDPSVLAGERIFLAPEHSFQRGPMILDARGRLVWFRPVPDGLVFNLEKQTYDGRPVLTWREDYPYAERMTRREYDELKRSLQIELLKLQTWIKETGQKIVLIFE